MNSSHYLLLPLRKYFSTFVGLPKACWQGIFINFFTFIIGDIFYFLSIYFVIQLHFSIATSGIIIGCYGIGATFGGFVGGRLSDSFDPAAVQRSGILLQAIGYFSLIFIKTPFPLMVVTTLLGAATYIFITSNYLFVLNKIKGHENLRLKAINILSMTSNMALGISALIVGTLSIYGFKLLFMVVTFLLLSEFIYLSLTPKTSEHELVSANSTLPTTKSSNEYNKIYDNKIIFITLLCVFLTGLSVSQLNSNYSLYIQHLFPNMGITAVSILFAVNSFMVSTIEAPLVGMFNKNNKLVMIGIGSLLIGIGFLLLNYAVVFSIAILACVIYTIGEMIFFSMAQFVCYQKSAHNKRGRSMGNYRVVYALTRVAGPIGGGIIFSRMGGHIIWYLSGMLGTICLLTCVYYKKYYQD